MGIVIVIDGGTAGTEDATNVQLYSLISHTKIVYGGVPLIVFITI